MPRARTKPNNPFIQSLLDRHGLKHLNELLNYYPGLSKAMLYNYADIADGKHQVLEALLRDSRALGVSVDELVCGLLGKEAS